MGIAAHIVDFNSNIVRLKVIIIIKPIKKDFAISILI